MIRFLLNNQLVSIKDTPADLTVLNYLRETRSLNGTKEGCASGDCGACTVVLAEVTTDTEVAKNTELSTNNESMNYRAINSCVTFLSALHGKQLITVEHLTSGLGEENLHPVQQAMIEQHASQCGFCTPGFVMSMFALYHSQGNVSRHDAIHALSGNLCRCTGYRPIIDAALASCNQQTKDKFSENEQNTIAQLIAIRQDQSHQTHQDQTIGTPNLLMPTNGEQMAEALRNNPNARLVAGSTDLALEVTQQLKPMDVMISVSQMHSLKQTSVTNEELRIGAACPINDISGLFLTHFPMLDEIIERFASLPIRNQATLGGNIANASPIGDMPPVLIALQASVVLDDGAEQQRVPLSEFFTGYRQTTLKTGQWIDSIVIPLPTSKVNANTKTNAKTHIRAYKISKRREDDISAVCAVFALSEEKGVITSIHSGFGGVAATPVSCELLTKELVGQSWQQQSTMALGKGILAEAFQPIDDVRASAEYRKQMLANLFQRFWLETNSEALSIPIRVNQPEQGVEHA